MKSAITSVLLALLLGACAPANSAPVSGTKSENHGHEHNHFYSHAGEDVPLGSAKAGEHTFTVMQKGKPLRGGLTVMELTIEGPAFDQQSIRGEVVDNSGNEIVPIGGFHPMSNPGQFGAHIGLPKDSPQGLKLRLRIKGTDSANSAVFEIRE